MCVCVRVWKEGEEVCGVWRGMVWCVWCVLVCVVWVCGVLCVLWCVVFLCLVSGVLCLVSCVLCGGRCAVCGVWCTYVCLLHIPTNGDECLTSEDT